MIKPIVKTLSLSFVMLAGASIAPATEQIPLLNLASPLTEFMPQAVATAPSTIEGKEATTRRSARSGLGRRM